MSDKSLIPEKNIFTDENYVSIKSHKKSDNPYLVYDGIQLHSIIHSVIKTI
jgi:hypothetical protein